MVEESPVIRVLAHRIGRPTVTADRHASESPVSSASSRPALGPPSAVADESHEVREPSTDVVVTPARIYVTVELPRCLPRNARGHRNGETTHDPRNCRERPRIPQGD